MEVGVELRESDATDGDNDGDRRPEPDLDPLVEDVPADGAEPRGRRYPSTIGGASYLLVLGVSAVGLGIVIHGDWRLGVRWVGSALVLAALARLALPTRQAGMLAVRRRTVDVLTLAGVGAALWFLASSIPNQPLL